MEKYGARVTYTCENCDWTVDYPLHQKDNPPLEKYASYCNHKWSEVDPEEIQDVDTKTEDN